MKNKLNFLILIVLMVANVACANNDQSSRSSGSVNSQKSTGRSRIMTGSKQESVKSPNSTTLESKTKRSAVKTMLDDKPLYKRDPYKSFKDQLRVIYYNDAIAEILSTGKCRAAIWLYNQRQKSGQYLRDEIIDTFMTMFLAEQVENEGCKEFETYIYTKF